MESSDRQFYLLASKPSIRNTYYLTAEDLLSIRNNISFPPPDLSRYQYYEKDEDPYCFQRSVSIMNPISHDQNFRINDALVFLRGLHGYHMQDIVHSHPKNRIKSSSRPEKYAYYTICDRSKNISFRVYINEKNGNINIKMFRHVEAIEFVFLRSKCWCQLNIAFNTEENDLTRKLGHHFYRNAANLRLDNLITSSIRSNVYSKSSIRKFMNISSSLEEVISKMHGYIQINYTEHNQNEIVQNKDDAQNLDANTEYVEERRISWDFLEDKTKVPQMMNVIHEKLQNLVNEIIPPKDNYPLHYNGKNVQSMIWIPYWTNEECIRKIRYLELDGTFKIMRPYVAFAIQGIIYNVGIPIAFAVAPTENSRIFQMIYDTLVSKGIKAQDLYNKPVLSDMGKGIQKFCRMNNIIYYICHRHLIEAFGSHKLKTLLCQILHCRNKAQFQTILKINQEIIDSISESDPKGAYFKRLIQKQNWPFWALWIRKQQGVSSCSNHAEGFHKHLGAIITQKFSLHTRFEEAIKLIEHKFQKARKSPHSNSEQQISEMFQRSKKLIESGLPGSCFALPFQDKIKDQFLLDHCSCPEKQYLTKLHDEPNFPCEHTVYMFVTKKIRLLTEKIEFEYSVDPMIQVEMKKSINQWKLIKNRRLPKTYDRYLSAGLGLIEKLNYHTTSDFIYYYKNLTRQIINEMSPEIVNPADIPILISLFVVNSIKPGYDIMKYENVITRDITKFISYEAFHGENFLEEVMNRIKALKEIKDQRETEEIKACKQYLRENTNQNQINIPRNKFVLPILNCSKPKYVMPIFNRI